MKKVNKTISVTVGIPAFNEEENIGYLIRELLTQSTRRINIEKIIVISDKSYDATEAEVRKIIDRRINLIINKKRIGKSLTQNKIADSCKSDFLVLLDADIALSDKNFLEKLIKPMLKNEEIGLVSPRINFLESKTFFGKIIDMSVSLKYTLYKKKNNGNNIYFCHGRARAFNKSLYNKIVWPRLASEDAYSYLFAVTNGFKFYYQQKTEVWYKSPQNYTDHKKQSIRFHQSKSALYKYFDQDFMDSEYALPILHLFAEFLKEILRNPLFLFVYFAVLVRIMISKNRVSYVWSASKSSKNLRYE